MSEHVPVNEPEAVAVFDGAEALEAAIDELRGMGVPRADISLLAEEGILRARLGKAFRGIEDLEDDPDAPRAEYVSRESLGAAEGALIGGPLYLGAVGAAVAVGVMAPAAGLAGAIVAATLGGGAGAAVGGIFARAVGGHHARYLREQMQSGGILLWTRIADPARREKMLEVLRRNSGRDVHVHDWTVAD